MALERVPADIRVQGGVARMSDPSMIKGIMEAVTIPVMAKARIGHFVECQVRCIPAAHDDMLYLRQRSDRALSTPIASRRLKLIAFCLKLDPRSHWRRLH